MKKKNEKTEDLNKFTNKIIQKIGNNLEKFNYNVIIANFHEIYNYLLKETANYIAKDAIKENYTKILYLLSPIIPHFAEECLSELNIKNVAVWPEADKKYLQEILKNGSSKASERANKTIIDLNNIMGFNFD